MRGDRGEKARVRAALSAGEPDIEILLQCCVCNHAWVGVFRQPVESMEVQECDACTKWEAVEAVVNRMARLGASGRVTRDEGISEKLIDAMAEYADARLKGGDA